jgi:hypothetical protein
MQMSKFNPALIKPASQSTEFAVEPDAKRTAKVILLEGIDKQKALFADPKLDGRRWFTVGKVEVAISLKVANRPLKLIGDEVRVAVPLANFDDAMAFYKAEVEAGKFDEQLTTLDGLREARTNKLRATRAEKKAAKEPAAKS